MTLKLFIAGRSERSERAIADARRICTRDYGEKCELLIVDVLEDPAQAERSHILATPTLIKEEPEPARRAVGDLADIEQVMAALGLISNKLKEINGTD